MDNICHTLVGAAIGECGARKTTPLAAATLLIGANLPDLDALAYAFGGPVDALAFRRGWTHGALAVAVWPFLLAGAVLLYDRMVRLRRPGTGIAPARFAPLLLLAFVAVLSHPLLDLLNTYGVRLLMPFSGRWFYGDTLFIVDPWAWLALGTGVVLSRRAARRGLARPHLAARVATGLVLLYVAAMRLSGASAGRTVLNAMEARGMTGARVMASPSIANPLRWNMVVAVGGGYALAEWDWTARPHVRGPWTQLPDNRGADYARAAAASDTGRKYLVWSRMPVFMPGGEGWCPSGSACIGDARYHPRDWSRVAVPLLPAVSWEVQARPPEEQP